MSKLLSATQAAKEAGVNKQYILNLIQEEIIQASMVGHQYVIERASFDAWLEKRREKQGQGSGTQA